MRRAPDSLVVASSRIPGRAASRWRRRLAGERCRARAANLGSVDDCGAPNNPSISHPVRRLHVELVIRLDGDKAHGWPGDCLADRLGIDEVALVRLHVRLHVLSRDDPHLMTLLPECSSQERSSGTCLPAAVECGSTSCAQRLRPAGSGQPGERSSCRDRCRSCVFA